MCLVTDDPPHTGGRTKRGMCSRHYARWRKFGDVTVNKLPQRGATPEEALLKVGWTVTSSGCWEWGGSILARGGYGRLAGKKAHRIAYETWVGPIPEGLLVRHKCDNPPCINPDHLEVDTSADNNRDMISRGRGINGNQRILYSEWPNIANRYRSGESSANLAREYGVGRSQITRIVSKQ